MTRLRVASANVRSLRTEGRRKTFLDWVKGQRFQICCLQETKLSPELTFDVPGYKTYFTEHGTMGGVGVLVDDSLQVVDSRKRKNVIRITLMAGQKKVTIITAYLHYRNQNNTHEDRSALY